MVKNKIERINRRIGCDLFFMQLCQFYRVAFFILFCHYLSEREDVVFFIKRVWDW